MQLREADFDRAFQPPGGFLAASAGSGRESVVPRWQGNGGTDLREITLAYPFVAILGTGPGCHGRAARRLFVVVPVHDGEKAIGNENAAYLPQKGFHPENGGLIVCLGHFHSFRGIEQSRFCPNGKPFSDERQQRFDWLLGQDSNLRPSG